MQVIRLIQKGLSILFLFCCIQASGQKNSIHIVGKWVYNGTVTQKGQVDCCVECPEVIEFKSNGSYIVLNDCYGENPNNPVVEKGTWEILMQAKKLILKNRNFLTNYHIHSSEKEIEFKVMVLNDKILEVKSKQGENERYYKMK